MTREWNKIHDCRPRKDRECHCCNAPIKAGDLCQTWSGPYEPPSKGLYRAYAHLGCDVDPDPA